MNPTVQEKYDAANAEVERIDAEINEVKANTVLSPEMQQSQVNLLTAKRNEAQKKFNRALFDMHVAGRERLWKVLNAMKTGTLVMQTPQNPAGFTTDEIERALTELKPDIERQASEDLSRSITEGEDIIKDKEAKITKLRAEIEEERRGMYAQISETFQEAPLFVALKYPKLASELCGEAIHTQPPATGQKPPVTSGAEGNSGAAAPGSAASDPYNEQMTAAITEESISQAIADGAKKYSNEEIWRKIRTKLGLPDMSRVPQVQRSKIYRLRLSMEQAGKL